MDLREFIKETLTQIASGVKEAQAHVEEMGGCVSPAGWRPRRGAPSQGVTTPREVDFDVAVVVSSGGESEGRLQVSVWGIKAAAGGASETTEQATSRVRFTVPVYLPPGNARQHLKAIEDSRDCMPSEQ